MVPFLTQTVGEGFLDGAARTAAERANSIVDKNHMIKHYHLLLDAVVKREQRCSLHAVILLCVLLLISAVSNRR